MPFPFEATVPFIAIVGFLYLAGQVLIVTQQADNLGKSKRTNLDNFDIAMMERDRRLTGHQRGQRDDPNPPAWFSTNRIIRTAETGNGYRGRKPTFDELKNTFWDRKA